jgi:TRAP-type C4-dicarboxylate transport system substrate-binding protein
MKRSVLSAIVVLAFLTMTVPAVHAGEVIKLKYSNFFPPMHKNAVLGAQFCEEIKKRTNGRVEISYFPGGTLTTAPKVFNGVVTGISDIGMSNIGYTRGRFPVTEVHDLPLGFPSGFVSTHVADDFYNKFKPKEWDAVKVLYMHSGGPVIIYTVKKPVRTLDDLKGLKIRGSGRVADIIKALGGTPMPLEMADMYEAMRRGVIDGSLGSMEQLKGWKTGEIARFATLSWRVGSVTAFYVVMNKVKWNSLPDDIKKIFDEVSAEWREKHALGWNEIDIEGREYLKSVGGQTIPLTENEVARWQSAVEPVITDYKKDLATKGFKPEEIEGYVKYTKDRIDFWRQKQNEKGVATPYE